MKNEHLNWALLFLCWLTATISTLGSLFFSEVMEFAPCVLCWYQRIALFPLVLMLAIGLFPFEKNVLKYALPLAAIGWGITVYHNLIYYDLIPKKLVACTRGVPCTENYLNLFGFITIPLLSLISFTIITILLLILFKRTST